jgi:FkbM family methyltransferase
VGTAKFLAAWLAPWRPAFRVRARDGLSFYVHHRDLIGRHIAKYGRHEPIPTGWLDDYLATAKPGLFVDVGANLGWHAVHAAQHRAVETVVAFEPDPFNAWLLDRNLALNHVDKAIVCCEAVGAQSGIARLHRYKSSNYGRHSLLADYGYDSRSVPLTSLDDALDRLGLGERPIAAIKIDVEGYEPAVIAGARRALARTGAVILEYSPDLSRAGGLFAAGMVDAFVAAGFATFALDEQSRLTPIAADTLRTFAGQMDLVLMRKQEPR